MQARRDREAARENDQRVRTAYAAGRIDGPAFIRAQREFEATRAYLSANREDVVVNRCGLPVPREADERAKPELPRSVCRREGAVGMREGGKRGLES